MTLRPSFYDLSYERPPPTFNFWLDIVVEDYVMVRLDTIEKCMGLELVWLVRAITTIIINEQSAMYMKLQIKWWELTFSPL